MFTAQSSVHTGTSRAALRVQENTSHLTIIVGTPIISYRSYRNLFLHNNPHIARDKVRKAMTRIFLRTSHIYRMCASEKGAMGSHKQTFMLAAVKHGQPIPEGYHLIAPQNEMGADVMKRVENEESAGEEQEEETVEEGVTDEDDENESGAKIKSKEEYEESKSDEENESGWPVTCASESKGENVGVLPHVDLKSEINSIKSIFTRCTHPYNRLFLRI